MLTRYTNLLELHVLIPHKWPVDKTWSILVCIDGVLGHTHKDHQGNTHHPKIMQLILNKCSVNIILNRKCNTKYTNIIQILSYDVSQGLLGMSCYCVLL